MILRRLGAFVATVALSVGILIGAPSTANAETIPNCQFDVYHKTLTVIGVKQKRGRIVVRLNGNVVRTGTLTQRVKTFTLRKSHTADENWRVTVAGKLCEST